MVQIEDHLFFPIKQFIFQKFSELLSFYPFFMHLRNRSQMFYFLYLCFLKLELLDQLFYILIQVLNLKYRYFQIVCAIDFGFQHYYLTND